MVGPERLFIDRDAALEGYLDVGVAVLAAVQLCEVIETSRDIGMVGPERLFPDRELRLRRGSASA